MIHRNITCERDGEVITKGSFCDAFVIFSGKDCFKILPCLILFRRVIQAIVQDLKDQFIALISILSHKGIQVFHGWCFQWFKPIEFKNRPYGGEDMVSLTDHVSGKISGTLGDRRFVRHTAKVKSKKAKVKNDYWVRDAMRCVQASSIIWNTSW